MLRRFFFSGGATSILPLWLSKDAIETRFFDLNWMLLRRVKYVPNDLRLAFSHCAGSVKAGTAFGSVAGASEALIGAPVGFATRRRDVEDPKTSRCVDSNGGGAQSDS